MVCLYAVAGWLSGLVGALVYDFFSRHFGFQVKGVTSAERLPD